MSRNHAVLNHSAGPPSPESLRKAVSAMGLPRLNSLELAMELLHLSCMEYAYSFHRRSILLSHAIMSELCKRTSERTSEWPNFNVLVLRFLNYCDLVTAELQHQQQ